MNDLYVMGELCPYKPLAHSQKAKRIYTAFKRFALGLILIFCVNSAIAQQQSSYRLAGTVLSAANGEALAGATVKIKGKATTALTDNKGYFLYPRVIKGDVLQVSYIGYKLFELTIDSASADLTIYLEAEAGLLDETVVIAYGKTTRRLNTGSVAKITADEISRAPMTNPLEALVARAPGVMAVQNNGNAGAGISVQVRGLASIAQGSQPLFLIDGIPFSNAPLGTDQITMTNAGQSPFANINPQDIASIEILKDADATAIYGSRGANGVVLITTKKGQAGKAKLNVNIYRGQGEVAKRMDYLNTADYLAMRREAFANDGIIPSAVQGAQGFAPDLMVYDTSRYTDWQNYFIGGTADYTNANLSLTGGSERTQYLVSANYNRQTAVFPGDLADTRLGFSSGLNHTSQNGKFALQLNANYSYDNNQQYSSDLTANINLPPNAPDLLDGDGQLRWNENGVNFANPLDMLFQESTVKTDNAINSLRLGYELLPGLRVDLNAGYTLTDIKQQRLVPIRSQNPANNPLGRLFNAYTQSRNWIVEPQLNWTTKWWKGETEVLVGYTVQRNHITRQLLRGEGYTADEVLEAAAFAGSLVGETSLTDYRYQAFFGRVNYNIANKYLFNITARRDGSSRFGPNKRWANFGAIGAGWIFSEEEPLKQRFKALSFGKIRGSYGLTGNDQIGDYQYLDDYGSAGYIYDGTVTYSPSRLFNADYAWEKNTKFELGLELGFLDNRVMLTANFYRNLSNNQLINYQLPDQTGFRSILRNFDASIENKGYEWLLHVVPFQQTNFGWDFSLNLTVERNKLLDFPGIESSSYANTYVVGQPLNIVKLYEAQGVDPATGLYQVNGTTLADRSYILDLTPRFYGGLTNNIRYKRFDLSLLFQFVKQKGYNYLYPTYTSFAPGIPYNQPVEVLQRWQAEGQETPIQRFVTTGTGVTAYNNYVQSSANEADASFFRLKTAMLQYRMPEHWFTAVGLEQVNVYLQGQNLFTLSPYKGLEPETQGLAARLPLLRIITLGIKLTI